MNKKAEFGRSAVTILLLTLTLFGFFFAIFVNVRFLGQSSIHEDARRYSTRHCLAFYPDSDQGKQMAKDICKDVKDDAIFDYTLIPYGDYYLISYGGKWRYFTDHNYQPLHIEGVDDEGRQMIVDYLRYTFKKERPEEYYNSKRVSELTAENIGFDALSYEIEGESLKCHIGEYDLDVLIPLKYIQKAIGMDFGFPDELYRKPVYIDPDPAHPIVCLTFDDGPQFRYEPGSTSSEKIVALLEKYDACASFFVIGDSLRDRENWADYQVYSFLKHSINQGNEYCSHTRDHYYELNTLSDEKEIYEEINDPIAYLKEFMDYDVRCYRPVAGAFNDKVLSIQPVPAILWDVDSQDWLSRDPQAIIEMVMKYDYESGDVVLFHDIYDETVEALETIIPEMVDKGIQLVSISDMLSSLDIELSAKSYYYSANYYE